MYYQFRDSLGDFSEVSDDLEFIRNLCKEKSNGYMYSIGDFVSIVRIEEPSNYFSKYQIIEQKFLTEVVEGEDMWVDAIESLHYSIIDSYRLESPTIFDVHSHREVPYKDNEITILLDKDCNAQTVFSQNISKMDLLNNPTNYQFYFRSLSELDSILEVLIPLRIKKFKKLKEDLLFVHKDLNLSPSDFFLKYFRSLSVIDTVITHPYPYLTFSFYHWKGTNILFDDICFNFSYSYFDSYEKIGFNNEKFHCLGQEEDDIEFEIVLSEKEKSLLDSGGVMFPKCNYYEYSHSFLFNLSLINSKEALFKKLKEFQLFLKERILFDLTLIDNKIKQLLFDNPYSYLNIHED